MTSVPSIAVIGAGAWGTALAASHAADGTPITILTRHAETAHSINHHHALPDRLPDSLLPPSLKATTVAQDALAMAEIVLVAIPAQTVGETLQALRPALRHNAWLVSCAKGIDARTGQPISAVMRKVAPDQRVGVLSGPSFATDVAKGLPTAVTVAADAIDDALDLARALSTVTLRCYASDDMIGVEMGGALKNVLAIAAGLTEGLGLGASARAAVISRGFAELRRLAVAQGGREETLGGLSGLGDLVLTCSSSQSRNFAFGVALAKQRANSAGPARLAEGAHTAAVAASIARRSGIRVPLIDAVETVLSDPQSLGAVMERLLARPITTE